MAKILPNFAAKTKSKKVEILLQGINLHQNDPDFRNKQITLIAQNYILNTGRFSEKYTALEAAKQQLLPQSNAWYLAFPHPQVLGVLCIGACTICVPPCRSWAAASSCASGTCWGEAVDWLVVSHLEGDFGMHLKTSQHLSEAVKSLSHFHVLSATLHNSCSTNLQYIEDV